MSSPRGTDGSLLASLPWTLAALVFSIAPHVQFLPVWITASFLGCAGWRYFIERNRRPLPSPWFRALLALGCFLGVFFTYTTISGVGPGSALLAVMAALKLLETRKRRDQFVLLFISIFLVMSSLLREQYLWSLPYLLIGVFFIMTAWLRVSVVAGTPVKRSVNTGSRLVLYAAPLAIAMWIFFPRLATPFWSVPMDTGTGTSGISDSMSPGDISSLSLSDAVAFRVKFNDQVPAQRELYWRGLVLSIFNGRSWTQDDTFRSADAEDQIIGEGEPISYQVTLEPTRQRWVFGLDIPWTWTLERTFMGRQQQLIRTRPIDQRVAYDVVSYPNYRTKGELAGFSRRWYQRVPENSNPRTQTLAAEMRAEAESDSDYINAVLRKFNQEEYFYTLEPPALGRDSVDQFLFQTRQGFCEHYASAFAVLMRSAGIPARIVIGYQGGELNPMAGHMIVRQSDAHAWTEVWLDGRGWYRIDPTAAVAPERIEAGRSGAMFDGAGAAWGLSAPPEWLHRLSLTWDAVNAKWNDWVLGYGPETQERFMQWLGMDDPDWRQMMLTLVGIIAVLVAVISLLLALRYRPPQRDRAAILYGRFVRKTGLAPQVGETPAAFACRASATSALPTATIDDVTGVYLETRYGPENEELLDKLENSVRAL